MPILRYDGPFRGFSDELDPGKIGPGMASSLLNVGTVDGTIRTRPGFDILNPSDDFISENNFDNFLRPNGVVTGVVLARFMTSGGAGTEDRWVTLAGPGGTWVLESGTLHPQNGIDVDDYGVRIVNQAETGSPFVRTAGIGVEFLLRKYEGFGNVDNSFNNSETAQTAEFSVIFSNTTTTTSDHGTEFKFDIPVGPGDSANRWKDLVLDVYSRNNGNRSAADNSTDTGDAPGVDEWIKIGIFLQSGGQWEVYADGVQKQTGTSAESITDTSFLKFVVIIPSSTGSNRKLSRQIQITSLRFFSLLNTKIPANSALAASSLDRFTRPDGTRFLIAKVGPKIVSSGVTEFFNDDAGGADRDYGPLGHTPAILNRRDSAVTTAKGTLAYTLGADTFTLTDTETSTHKGGLTSYSFTAGDLLHIIRPNTRAASDDDLITGTYGIVRKDSDTVLVLRGSPATSSQSGTIAYRIISGGGSDGFMIYDADETTVPDVAAANSNLFMADTRKRPIRVDGTSAHLVGLKAPEIRPAISNFTVSGLTPAHVAPSSLSGDSYIYRFTYYNEVLRIESEPSLESIAVALTNGAKIIISLGIEQNAHDMEATHVRLYRKNTTDTDVNFAFVKQIIIPLPDDAGLVTVYDHIDDGNESLTVLSATVGTRDLPPENVRFCEFHGDRMFWAKDDTSKLYHSEIGVPDYVNSTSFLFVGREDGQKITGLKEYRTQLVVFKERSLWLHVGDDEDDFTVQKMFDIGCSSHETIVEGGDGWLYFAGETGIHRWNGVEAQDLDYGIRPTYYGHEMSRLSNMAAAIDVEDGLYFLSVTTSGGSAQNRLLVLNYRRPPVEAPGGLIYDWWIWDIAAEHLTVDSVSGVRKIRFSKSDGTIGTYKGASGTAVLDDTTGITWHWEGIALEMGTKRDKLWKALNWHFEKVSTSSNISIGYTVNDDTTPAKTVLFDQSERSRKLINVRRRAIRLKPRIEATASTVASRILAFELEANVIGRR